MSRGSVVWDKRAKLAVAGQKAKAVRPRPLGQSRLTHVRTFIRVRTYGCTYVGRYVRKYVSSPSPIPKGRTDTLLRTYVLTVRTSVGNLFPNPRFKTILFTSCLYQSFGSATGRAKDVQRRLGDKPRPATVARSLCVAFYGSSSEPTL